MIWVSWLWLFVCITFYKVEAKTDICCLYVSVYRQKIDEQKADIERLEHILDSKVEVEKKNIGNFLCCDI